MQEKTLEMFQTFPFETTNEKYSITETQNRGELYGTIARFSNILWSPFPLIYGFTDRFQSHLKKQERNSNRWNFFQVSWATSMVGWVLHTQSKTASPTVSVPRSWGTTCNSCRCWGQRKNCVENGVLLAIYVIETVCYHRCQNRLHLKSTGVYRTWLASYILTFVTVSDGMLFKSLAFSLIFSLI